MHAYYAQYHLWAMKHDIAKMAILFRDLFTPHSLDSMPTINTIHACVIHSTTNGP